MEMPNCPTPTNVVLFTGNGAIVLLTDHDNTLITHQLVMFYRVAVMCSLSHLTMIIYSLHTNW